MKKKDRKEELDEISGEEKENVKDNGEDSKRKKVQEKAGRRETEKKKKE